MIPKQHRYSYSPIDRRPDYSWPGGKRLAFWIGTNIEVFAFGAGMGPDPVMPSEPTTQRNFAWRDYGNRIGVWRLFDLFDELKLPCSCIVNSLVYEHHPEILERIRARGDDIIGHGRTNAERQRGLWEADERRLIEDATEAIRKHGDARRRAGSAPEPPKPMSRSICSRPPATNTYSTGRATISRSG